MSVCQFPEGTVIWEDAWIEPTEFVTADAIVDAHMPWTVETKGWVLVNNEVGVSIANERVIIDGRERFRGRTFIPGKMVKKVTIKKKRTKKSPDPLGESNP